MTKETIEELYKLNHTINQYDKFINFMKSTTDPNTNKDIYSRVYVKMYKSGTNEELIPEEMIKQIIECAEIIADKYKYIRENLSLNDTKEFVFHKVYDHDHASVSPIETANTNNKSMEE